MRIEIQNKKEFIKMFNDLFNDFKINKINGISIDSRKIEQDDIYIPIKGDNYDGHDFIQQAFESGALLSFSERKNKRNKTITVESSNSLIFKLAQSWNEKSKTKIIAITGSNGKTTTKELLTLALSKKYICSKSKGNQLKYMTNIYFKQTVK